MIIPYMKKLMNVALLLLFMSIASTDILLNKSRRARTIPSNCIEAVRAAGSEAKSGIYQIQLALKGWTHRPFYVYCLLDGNAGDPWLVVQRRQDTYINFFRDWNDYKIGFGNMEASFFIGLDLLHAITQVQFNELQIELRDFNDTVKYANYDSFAVGNENEKYALNILGKYSGSAGDGAFDYHRGQSFTTWDLDNDRWWHGNCAAQYKGGWWYNKCHDSCLNGEYIIGENCINGMGIIWSTWHGSFYSLKYAHMAIRPIYTAEMREHKDGMRTNEAHTCRKIRNRSHSCKNSTNKG